MSRASDHAAGLNSALSGIRRAEQVFYEQVGDRRTLEHGIAFFDVEFPDSDQDNAFREVLIESPAVLPDAWSEAEAFYSSLRLTCRRWIPCLGQPGGVIEPFLTPRGMAIRTFTAMSITRWPAISQNSRLRIFPARAVRQAFRSLHENDALARTEERRLDYSQFDVHVATLEGRPAGRCGFMQAGEIGQICNLFVAQSFRRQSVGRTLVAHALDMARRLMMKVVCCKVDSTDARAVDFFRSCGFEDQGQLVEFHRR